MGVRRFWRRLTGPARIWFGLLLGVGTVCLAVGLLFGDGHDHWLADQNYLVNILATLTTGAFGGALAIGLANEVVARQDEARAEREARRAAGRVVADMMDTALLPLAREPGWARDWRYRGRHIQSRLAELARSVEQAREGARALRTALRSDDQVTRSQAANEFTATWQALRAEWSSVVGAPQPSAWVLLRYEWQVLEQDIRTRLLAAGGWVPQDLAVRMPTLLEDPVEVLGGHPVLITDLDVVIQPGRPGHLVEVHAEVPAGPDRAVGEPSFVDLIDHQALAEVLRVLDTSQDYVDRLRVVVVQLHDLGQLYPPPSALGLSSPSGLAQRAAHLGDLSGIGLDDISPRGRKLFDHSR